MCEAEKYGRRPSWLLQLIIPKGRRRGTSNSVSTHPSTRIVKPEGTAALWHTRGSINDWGTPLLLVQAYPPELWLSCTGSLNHTLGPHTLSDVTLISIRFEKRIQSVNKESYTARDELFCSVWCFKEANVIVLFFGNSSFILLILPQISKSYKIEIHWGRTEE